ncbi:MAG: Fibronectin type domain protein [Bacteroidetes bacterium]|nr:Fibronectin type domain protein [Bacteroidota bacterium]
MMILLISTVVRAQAPGASSMVFRFTKEVWLNPTIILAKQNFEQSTNVKLMILPRLNASDTAGNSRIEKAFDKLLSFLVYKDNVQGSIKFYFNPSNTTKPFTFNTSEELWCKFTDVQKDSVESILNQNIPSGANLTNFTALPFDSIVSKASRYCRKVLYSKPGQCGPDPGNEFKLTEINSTPSRLTFVKDGMRSSGNNGGVDKQQYPELVQFYNSAVDKADNSNYPIAWKALSTSGPDNIRLKLKKNSQNFDITKVVFKNAAGNETYNATYQSDSTLSLSISGQGAGTMKEVVAYYTTTSPAHTYAIGAFNVFFYQPKTYKLKLVNLGGYNNMPPAAQVRDSLNKIYGNVFVNWTVETVSSYSLSATISKNIHVENSSLLSNYMPDMQAIVNDFKDNCTAYDSGNEDTYYLLFGATNDGNMEGYMPRGRNTGFIFGNPNEPATLYATIAHELGHGAFNLQHIFCNDELGAGNKFTTNNLMDYYNGLGAWKNQLYKHQWDLIHNPGFVGWFGGDDDEGANYSFTWLDYELFKNPDNKTISFLSKAGTIVSVPVGQLKRVEFTYGAQAKKGEQLIYANYIPSGTLDEFVLKETTGSGKVYRYEWNDPAKAYKQTGWANEGDAAYTTIADGALYNDVTNYQLVDGFVFLTICEGKYKARKFIKHNLEQYVKGSRAMSDFVEFSIDLFGAVSPIAGKEQEKQLSYYAGCRFCANAETIKMTKEYCETSHYVVADKIAQLRAVYPEYFARFTDSSEHWLFPAGSIVDAFGQHVHTNTSLSTYCDVSGLKPWEKYICSRFKAPDASTITYPYSPSVIPALLDTFLTDFKMYIAQRNIVSNNFWNNGSIAGTSRNGLIEWVMSTAMFNLENIPDTKRDSCMKKILDAPVDPNFQVVATIIDDLTETAVIKLMLSARTETAAKKLLLTLENYQFPNYQGNDYKGFQFIFTTFNDVGGDDNLTGAFFAIAELINTANTGIYDSSRINQYLAAADPQLPATEQNLFSFAQYSSAFASPTTITINGVNYAYNEMVTIRIAGSFSMGGKIYRQGTLITIPAIQARIFDYNNTCEVGEKASWLAVDVGSLCLGIGGAKILFTAGNWLRKAIVVGDLVGSASGIVVQSLDNDAMSPSLRIKLQLASLALNVPQLLTCLPKVSKAVDEIDLFIDAKRFSVDSKDIDAINALRLEKTKLIAQANLTRYANCQNFLQTMKSKLGFRPKLNTNLDFSQVVINPAADNYIDVIVHYKNGNFVLAKEGGLTKDIPLEDLAGIINAAPPGKTVRLLSCNDLDAAKQLSLLTNKPFYASDGWVDLYVTGEIRSQNVFMKFENGVESSSSMMHGSTPINGVSKVTLGLNVSDDLASLFPSLVNRTNAISKLETILTSGRVTRPKLIELVNTHLIDVLNAADNVTLGKILDRLNMSHVDDVFIGKMMERLNKYPALKQDLVNHPAWFETFDEILSNPGKYWDVLQEANIPSNTALTNWGQGYWWKDLKDAAKTYETTAREGVNGFKAATGITDEIRIVEQVTLEINGTTIRIDYLGRDASGKYHFGDAKFSTKERDWINEWLNSATDNQGIIFPLFQNGNVNSIIVKATTQEKLSALSQIGLANNSTINFSNTSLRIFGSNANQQSVKTIVTLKN